MTLLPGARVGSYEIAARIDAGGMGVLYRAHDTRLRRDVALKLLGTDRDTNHDDLLREARTIAALNHPHICTVHEVDTVDGVSFIAMELIEGESLRSVIASGRCSAERVWRIGRQLADALEHAHAHGVIHRDFKTANVMITPDGRAKVVDFGISLRTAAPTEHTATAGAEADPRISGTIPYLAPELLRGGWPDARSDIWALGVVLYEMTCGQPPFAQRTTSELMAAILRDPPKPLPPGTAATLVRVIDRCLAKDPGDRPARAGEVALALEVAEPLSMPIQADKASARGRFAGHTSLLIGTAAAVVVAGLAYWLWPRASDVPGYANCQPSPGDDGGRRRGISRLVPGRKVTRVRRARARRHHHQPDVELGHLGRPARRRDGHQPDERLRRSRPVSNVVAGGLADRLLVRPGRPGCYVMAALSGAPRRIAAANRLDPNPPQWSEDGRDILCVSGDRRTVLDVVSVETGQVQRSVELPGDLPRFVTRSRDERLIAFVAGPGGLGADLTQLSVLDVESSKVTPITDGQTLVSSPNWSADGRTLYYVAHTGAAMDLWEQRLAADGAPIGEPRPLTAGIGMRNAALSRDGRRLAYSQGRKVGNVWRVPFRPDRPATWADAEQLTFDQAYIECVSLNRAGTTLAVNSDRAGSIDLWTLPASGGELHRITSDPSAEWCPDWSPDGSLLAFFAHRTGNREIWTVPVTGGAWQQITNHPGPDLHPSWSHDGRLIGHVAGGRGESSGGWISPVDGGPGRQVAPSLSTPRWSPTDGRIAYFNTGRVWVADIDAGTPARALTEGVGSGLQWTPDGSAILYRSRTDAIHIVDAIGKSTGRLLVDLSGRPGEMGFYGTPTDGRFVYFVWGDDLGDIWVMDIVSSAR